MSRPQGHDQIVTAVVQAAAGLMAERGPAAVTLRQVAREAGVTLSLIHRHIGNKEALLSAVLAHDLLATAPGGVGFGELDLATFLKVLFRIGEASVRTRLQARIILDGYDLPALQHRFPGIELAISLLSKELSDEEARVRAALFAAFFAGWELLGPTYLRVTGVDDIDQDRFAQIVAPVLEAIAAAGPAAGTGEKNTTSQ